MTPELSPRRRFLLMGVLPVSLLLIAVPLAPFVAPQVQQTLRDTSAWRASAKTPHITEVRATMNAENMPRTDPSLKNEMRASRRMVARDVLDRLESETRQNGGKTRLSPLDVKRLRNALH